MIATEVGLIVFTNPWLCSYCSLCSRSALGLVRWAPALSASVISRRNSGCAGRRPWLNTVLAQGFQQLSWLGTLLVLQPGLVWSPRAGKRWWPSMGCYRSQENWFGLCVLPAASPLKLHTTVRAEKVASSSPQFLHLEKGKKPWSNSMGLIL